VEVGVDTVRNVEDAVGVEIGEERNVGDAVAGAEAVDVGVTATAVAAEVDVSIGDDVVIGNKVAVVRSTPGDGLGVTVSANGMIRGGKVGMSASVGVTARGVGVEVCNEN
jgi:hypothetical protein